MAETPNIAQARFIKGAARPEQFPDWDLPEIAFGGRSNVGKSSLLRVLAGSRRLVRVSRTPGRTQEVNFFTVALDGRECAFVDLPGYGYAKVPGRLKQLWGRTVERYVTERASLAGVVLLVDARRGPEEEEQALVDLLGERGCPAVPVFTKIDKLPKTRLQGTLETHQRALGLRGRPLGFSALTGEGRDEVLRRLARLLPAPAPAGGDGAKRAGQGD